MSEASPKFSDEDWQQCQQNDDFRPILFEWYKFVGAACAFVAHIQPDSPAVRNIPPIHYAVAAGLLNRCARLMLSNLSLSHGGRFGETTAIVDRCIFESAIRLIWLCQKENESDRFVRYLADGLQTELELKNRITDAIAARGAMIAIEKRMLDSISRHLVSAGIAEDDVRQAKRLPNLAATIESIGKNRLIYVVFQRIGSHHVHGTWPSLVMHYLQESAEGDFVPRAHDCDTHVNQYAVIPLLVLEAMNNFVRFIFTDDADVAPMTQLFEAIGYEIEHVLRAVAEGDREIVKSASRPSD